MIGVLYLCSCVMSTKISIFEHERGMLSRTFPALRQLRLLTAMLGCCAESKNTTRGVLGAVAEREPSERHFPRRTADKVAAWGPSPTAAGGKARSPGLSGGGRQAFRTTSLDTAAAGRDALTYKDEDDSRFNFGGHYSGGPPPNRTASLEAGPRRDWDEPGLRGLRLDRTASLRRDTGSTRRPESARSPAPRVSCSSSALLRTLSFDIFDIFDRSCVLAGYLRQGVSQLGRAPVGQRHLAGRRPIWALRDRAAMDISPGRCQGSYSCQRCESPASCSWGVLCPTHATHGRCPAAGLLPPLPTNQLSAVVGVVHSIVCPSHLDFMQAHGANGAGGSSDFLSLLLTGTA